MVLHLSGKMKRKITSYFVSQCSNVKPSHERRESGVEREMQDDNDETEADSEGECSPVALHGSEHSGTVHLHLPCAFSPST